jgi:HD-GYP domain-containing protein (c-di-GMP phosphodiesterase class II)
MRLTPLSRAVGHRLARDLPPTGPNRIPLLRSGTVVTPRFERALAEHGIHAVWIEDELSEGIEPVALLPEPVRMETAAKVASALDEARAAIGHSQHLPQRVVTEMRGVVDLIAASIADSSDAALFLGDLAAADQYTHRHSVNVTALGLLLGRAYWRTEGWVDFMGRRRWDRIDERLAKLGMGLLLHDIGKMVVPAEVLAKPGKLDEDEWKLVRTHPEAGVALLDTAAIGPLVCSVVRDHHERWDGSGYPRGIGGERIGELPRIAAVADVYDAITSRRPYAAAEPAHVGVRVIEEGGGQAFDPKVVGVFRRLVLPYPVGTEVELPDGRVGVVSAADPDRPDAPLVRVDGSELRLDLGRRGAAAWRHSG